MPSRDAARSSSSIDARVPGDLVQWNYVNNSPSIIPSVETEHQKLALGLFREVASTNNDYLAFLFYWHAIETGHEKGEEVF